MPVDLLTHIESNARNQPRKAGFVFEDERLTYGDLHERVRHIAGGLLQAGLEPGDRVVIASYRGVDVVTAYYGLIWAGLVPVLASFATLPELPRLMEMVGAVGVLHGPQAAAHLPARPLKLTVDLGARGLAPLLGGPAVERTSRTGDDLSGISFSAGTTGFPKAIYRTFTNDLWYGIQRLLSQRMSFNDAFIFKMPLNLSAFLGGSRQTLLAGSTHVTISGWDVDRVLGICQRERATHLQLLADQWAQVLDHPGLDRYDLSSLRELAATAGQIPVGLRQRVQERFGRLPFTSVYGTTEAGMIAVLDANDPAAGRDSCVGRPVPSTTVRVVDADGQPCAPGVVGEVTVRGASVSPGYVDEAQSRAAFRDGWFHTGDLGAFDEEDYLYVYDRAKDVGTVGNVIVYPSRVQGRLYRQPGVRQAAVVVQDGVVTAFVVPLSEAPFDPAGIRSFVATEVGVDPAAVRVHALDSLPTTTVGKLDRAALVIRATA